MGCICDKDLAIDNHIFLNRNTDILIKHPHKKCNTPSSYLMNNHIDTSMVPPFIIEFYDRVNQKMYTRCSHNHYKDIYFFNDVIYTVECVKYYIFKNIQQLHNITCDISHVVSYENIFYMPHDEKEGILIQKMPLYELTDMFTFCISERRSNRIDINLFVYQLASTLKELHENDIFLNDIKLENIVGRMKDDKMDWAFTDTEYAYIGVDFLEGDIDKENIRLFRDRMKGRFRWIKTIEYIPDNTYPCCRKIAERNDCFALARCIGTVICFMKIGSANTMFYGNGYMYVYDLRHILKDVLKDDLYVHHCGNAVAEYDTYANDSFLDELISKSRPLCVDVS